MFKLANDETLKIEILLLTIDIYFDRSPGQLSCLPLNDWRNIHDTIISVFGIYQNIKKIHEGNLGKLVYYYINRIQLIN